MTANLGRRDRSSGDDADDLADLLREAAPERQVPPVDTRALAAFFINLQPLPDGSLQFRRNDRGWSPAVVDMLHRATVDARPYFAMIVDANFRGTAIEYVEQYIAEMQPRNPAERMLAVQMLWQHARISRLVYLMAAESRCDVLKEMNAAIDAAMSVYRKQALTWQELRTPRPVQIIRGHQVNMADKQLIAQSTGAGAARQLPTDSREVERQNVSNKQGCEGPQTPPALPAERTWPGCFEGDRAECKAVAVEHRPADAGR